MYMYFIRWADVGKIWIKYGQNMDNLWLIYGEDIIKILGRIDQYVWDNFEWQGEGWKNYTKSTRFLHSTFYVS